jgi:hypothetical protein
MYDWPATRTQFVNAVRSAAIYRRVNQDALILGGLLFQIPPAWVSLQVCDISATERIDHLGMQLFAP